MRFWLAIILIPAAFAQQQKNFISCPIVRDTKTVPCFLAEYEGETYFLTVQTDITAEQYPPQLLHEVLVEGTVVPGPRVCGGIPLKPLRLSVLPEVNKACNTILPAEPGIEAPPTRRPAGPSTKQAPVSTAPPAPEKFAPPFTAREWKIPFDFDSDFLFARDTRVVNQAIEYARVSNAKQVEVTGYRAATLLSNGKTIVERDSVASERVNKVTALLKGLGVANVTGRAVPEAQPADPEKRLAVIRIIP